MWRRLSSECRSLVLTLLVFGCGVVAGGLAGCSQPESSVVQKEMPDNAAPSDADASVPMVTVELSDYERTKMPATQVFWNAKAIARVSAPPLGLPAIVVPEDNPLTVSKIELGRKLFFDRRLSANNTMSCAICHIPEQGFTNNELATPIGVEGRSLKRNAPTVLNVVYQDLLFHDGRAVSLEDQATKPLLAREEMANPSAEALIEKISGMADYDGMFEAAFDGGPTVERIAQAIASWERTLVVGDSAFDRWHYGEDAKALTPEQQQGYQLFTGKAGCATCHTIGEKSALFTDQQYHNTGIGYLRDEVERNATEPVEVEIAPGVSVPVERATIASVGDPPAADLGRFETTKQETDRWRFKTPSLRNVAVTAPYMHDGSMQSLEDVVQHYNQGGAKHGGLDPRIRPLDLTDAEVAALVAFLESLTSNNLEELKADARSVPVGN